MAYTNSKQLVDDKLTFWKFIGYQFSKPWRYRLIKLSYKAK